MIIYRKKEVLKEMKIKRNFAYGGLIRKFRIYINDEHVSNVKLLQEVEVQQPEDEFIIHFETMLFNSSRKYRIKTNEQVRIVANVNPLVRLFGLIPLAILAFLYFSPELSIGIVIGIMIFTIAYLFIYIGLLQDRYITFKVYDSEQNLIPKEEVADNKK